MCVSISFLLVISENKRQELHSRYMHGVKLLKDTRMIIGGRSTYGQSHVSKALPIQFSRIRLWGRQKFAKSLRVACAIIGYDPEFNLNVGIVLEFRATPLREAACISFIMWSIPRKPLRALRCFSCSVLNSSISIKNHRQRSLSKTSSHARSPTWYMKEHTSFKEKKQNKQGVMENI